MGISHFSAVSGVFSVYTKTSGTDITLTAQEAADNTIFDITPSANISLIFPAGTAQGKMIIVRDEAGATYSITPKVSGQTGVAIAATKTAILKCNGTDFERVTADV